MTDWKYAVVLSFVDHEQDETRRGLVLGPSGRIKWFSHFKDARTAGAELALSGGPGYTYLVHREDSWVVKDLAEKHGITLNTDVTGTT